ncbi:hypothetical protein LTR66_006562 [Elasticomyces elasticus]|nr:hypothetical protein LTR66_006562 [Elasticomyces elasticus]
MLYQYNSQYKGEHNVDSPLYTIASELLAALQASRKKLQFFVSQDSSTLEGVEKHGLHRSHRDLVRFQSANDEDYRNVLQPKLEAYIQVATTQVQERLNSAKKSEQTYSDVPPAAVSEFFGREGILQQIKEAFDQLTDPTKSPPPVVVLQAMGGQGKSQIAMEYCRSSQSRYHGIFWIDATSENTVQRRFETLAQKLDPSAAAVLDDLGGKIPHNPTYGFGSIIITSRHEESHSYARPGIENVFVIPSMMRDGGLDLLRHYLDPSSTNDEGDPERSELIQRLGGLALAIDQAAAYISFHKLSVSDFLTDYESQRKKILQHYRKGTWEYNKHVNDSENEIAVTAYTTWEMSFQQIEPNDRSQKEWITRFLSVSAFLQPLRIGEHVFREYYSSKSSLLAWLDMFASLHNGDGTDDESESAESETDEPETQPKWKDSSFWEVIRSLEQLSLINSTGRYSNKMGAWFSIHPVIRDWLQIRMRPSLRKQTLQESIRLVGAIVRTEFAMTAPLDIKQELQGHVDLLADSLESLEAADILDGTVVGREFVSFGYYYGQSGQTKKAVKLLEHVVRVRKANLAENHPARLASQHELARTYLANGEIQDAVELLEHVVRVREANLAENHPNRLASQHELARVYLANGRIQDAAELLEHIARVEEANLAENHPDRLTSEHSLAYARRIGKRTIS